MTTTQQTIFNKRKESVTRDAAFGFRHAGEFMRTSQLRATYDRSDRAIWLRMQPQPRPCFNPGLLRDLDEYCQRLTRSDGCFNGADGEALPIDCAVLASGSPGVFNLGGDLALFMQLIRQRDREGLIRYGEACVRVVYRNYIGHGIPVQTISLVQGECLGGGFEAALSSDTVIAERSSRFGFPEVLFNLFPGMGACSLLERRIGRHKAERLLKSGKVFSAGEMLELGAIDEVVADGTGESVIRERLGGNRHMRNGLLGLAQARRRVYAVGLDELSDVVNIWVQHALRLTERDLKLMSRLVTRQNTLLPDE